MAKRDDERTRQIARLQDNLSAIRKIAGWSAADLGDKIGVTKQTIGNLENGKTKMGFPQYVAIRTALDMEIEDNPDNELLPKVVAILLDSDDLDEEGYREAAEITKTVAATASGGASAANLGIVFNSLLAATSALSPALVVMLGANAASAAVANWKRLMR